MQELHLDTIGTHLRIVIDTSSPIGEDFSHIEKGLLDFEKKYSRFIEGNWLHALNISRQSILDEDAKKMLEFTMKLAKNTGGYFDPTIGKRLTELGYGMERKQGKQRSLKNHGDYKDIEISGDMIVLHGDIDLEFGGIGKGYMLGWISEFLQKYERFLIDFGGDLSGKGSWKVGLENPFALDEAIGVMILDDEFLACSSGAKRKWGEHHHLINPHTGESASEVMASFVESKDSMTADGYATTLCVMPWNLACETLEKTPEIEGVLISKEGKIFQSKGSKSELFS